MMKKTFSMAAALLCAMAAGAWAAPAGMVVEPHASYNTGIADCDVAASGGSIIAIAGTEWEQSKDLNKDGDQNDRVLVYYDVAKRRPYNTNITMADGSISTDGEIIVFYLAGSNNLAYYSIKSNKLFDTGIMDANFGMGTSGPSRVVSEGRIVYNKSSEICYYDIARSAETCTGIEGVDPWIEGGKIAYQKALEWWYWWLPGEIAVYDIATGQETVVAKGRNPRLADGIVAFMGEDDFIQYTVLATGQTFTTPITDTSNRATFSMDNGIIAALVDERSWPSYWGDLNADGDEDDYELVVYYDINTGRLVNPMVQGCCGLDIKDGVVTYDNWEGFYDEDYTGDGVDSDCVQHYMVVGGVDKDKKPKKMKNVKPRMGKEKGHCHGGGCGKKN